MSKPASDPWVQLRDMRPHHVPAAAKLLARAMADNPTHEAVFGEAMNAPDRQLVRLFVAVVSLVQSRGSLVGAWNGETLVGLVGMLPPGACRLTWLDMVRMAGRMAPGLTPRSAWRLMRWQLAWHRHHPRTPHWHMGPFAVDPKYRGRLGVRLIHACCRRLDTQPAPAYLETDKPRNVTLYRHFGFRIIGEGRVVGVPSWFMLRPGSER